MAETTRQIELFAAGEDDVVVLMVDHSTNETYQLFELDEGASAWIKVKRYETLAEAEADRDVEDDDEEEEDEEEEGDDEEE